MFFFLGFSPSVRARFSKNRCRIRAGNGIWLSGALGYFLQDLPRFLLVAGAFVGVVSVFRRVFQSFFAAAPPCGWLADARGGVYARILVVSRPRAAHNTVLVRF